MGLAAWLLGLVLSRSAPALGYAVCSRRLATRTRVAVLCVGVVCTVALTRTDRLHLFFLMGGLAYFLLLAVVVALFGPRLRMIAPSPAGIFCLCASACVLVPCIVAPVPEANAVRLLGFEMTLSMYSLLFELSLARRPIAPRDAVFFMIVNPTLVWPERGSQSLERSPGDHRGATRRLLAGAGAITLSGLLLERYRHLEIPASLNPVEPLLAFTVFGLGMCLFHWGGAGIQLACMRLLGWRVPERYDRPWVATNPLDFWGRWNTYVGAWLRRYVFTPRLLEWRRSFRGKSPAALQGAAVLWTFVVSGLLHDLVEYPAQFSASLRWVTAFAVAGLSVVVWEVVRRSLSTVAIRRGATTRSLAFVLAVGGSTANVVHLMWMHEVLTVACDDTSGPPGVRVDALAQAAMR